MKMGAKKMVVITMSSCPPKLRGDLTKWLIEIHTGVYVGQINAKVRDLLWVRICDNIRDGQATMVYSFANEQHLEFRTHNTAWRIRDFDGIKLAMRTKAPAQTSEALPKGFSSVSKRLMAGRRRRESADMEHGWIFLGIETDGLDFEKGKILEIAAIVANKKQIESSWSVLVRQNKALPSEIVEVSHLTKEVLDGGIELDIALRQLSDIVKGRTVVCFNKSYCIAFLEREFRRNSIEIPFGKVIDSLILARKRVRDINDYTLESLAEYFGISCVQHRAQPDCEILYKVFLKLNEI